MRVALAAALTTGSYACFLAAETALPFLYMPDCLAATYQLMMADPAVLQQARSPGAGYGETNNANADEQQSFRSPWQAWTFVLQIMQQPPAMSRAETVRACIAMKPEPQPQSREAYRVLGFLSRLIVNSAGTVRAQRTYNVTAMTFTPAELAAAIREHLPGFNVQYLPDFRESIARSWPTSINDDCARRDWGWAPRYDLQVGASERN